MDITAIDGTFQNHSTSQNKRQLIFFCAIVDDMPRAKDVFESFDVGVHTIFESRFASEIDTTFRVQLYQIDNHEITLLSQKFHQFV